MYSSLNTTLTLIFVLVAIRLEPTVNRQSTVRFSQPLASVSNLILVLVEIGLRAQFQRLCNLHECVLILVLVEIGLGARIHGGRLAGGFSVLILVLVEIGLGEIVPALQKV